MAKNQQNNIYLFQNVATSKLAILKSYPVEKEGVVLG